MYLLFCSNNKMSHIQQFYELPSVTHGFSHGLKIARPRRIEMGSNPPTTTNKKCRYSDG